MIAPATVDELDQIGWILEVLVPPEDRGPGDFQKRELLFEFIDQRPNYDFPITLRLHPGTPEALDTASLSKGYFTLLASEHRQIRIRVARLILRAQSGVIGAMD